MNITMLLIKKIKCKSAPRRRAMLEPVLSEVPPNIEVTLTALFCKDII